MPAAEKRAVVLAKPKINPFGAAAVQTPIITGTSISPVALPTIITEVDLPLKPPPPLPVELLRRMRVSACMSAVGNIEANPKPSVAVAQ